MEEKQMDPVLEKARLKPSDSEVKETISIIEQRVSDKKINMSKNAGVKEGYTRAIEILKSGKLDFDGLKTVQGRAIAAITFDYLNGECTQEVLVNVPIKTRP